MMPNSSHAVANRPKERPAGPPDRGGFGRERRSPVRSGLFTLYLIGLGARARAVFLFRPDIKASDLVLPSGLADGCTRQAIMSRMRELRR